MDALIADYRRKGWNDEAAIRADIQAKGLATAGGGGYDAAYNEIAGQVNKYVDELIGQSQGDYDFAAKYIEDAYKKALGEGDTERAQFFKEVANATEKKVGRVAFDYTTNKYRIEGNKDRTLKRLAEDEQTMNSNFNREADQGRATQNTSLNARGLIDGTRSQMSGLGGKNVRDYETELQAKREAMERSLTRGREDINLGAQQNIEDLTTQSRRAGEDSQTSYDYSLQSQQRQLANRKTALEGQRRSGLKDARFLAYESDYGRRFG